MYLHALPKLFTILTDHHNLESFKTKTLLNRRQARWAGELAQYDFTIVFRPGEKNGKANALTYRSGDLPEEGDEHARLVRALIPSSKFSEYSLSAASIGFNDEIRTLLPSDALGKSILLALENFETKHPTVPLGECTYDDGLLYVNKLLYIQDNELLQAKVLNSCHEHPAAGHSGRAATYELVSRNYWWPKMRKTIARYIQNCDTCMRIKPARHAPYGLLKPLEIPIRR